MGRLTEEEKILFLKYHEYVYRRIKLHNSKHAFLIKREVDKCLIRLIKNNCTPILCDMYIDYIDNFAKKLEEKKSLVYYLFLTYPGAYAYKYFLTLDKDAEYTKLSLELFCDELLHTYKKTDNGYTRTYEDNGYYLTNWQNENNIEMFKLRDYVSSLMSDIKDEYHAAYNTSLMSLMTYIILNGELFKEEIYQPLFNTLRDKFDYLYDSYLLNNQDLSIRFFQPKEFIKSYNEGFYKKEIK